VTSRRLTVQEAAEVLGTSVDAVRMRVRRGSLQSEKDADGRVHVWVDEDSSETKLGLDGKPSMLISAKDETIHILNQQLEAERRANEENRRIIAALTSRIPAIEAPTEASASPETVEDEPERAEPRPDRVEAQTTTQHQQAQRPSEGVEHDASTLREWTGDVEGRPQEGAQRSWWRRMFGG
jgi:excisionase family DNA binding protein